MNGARLVRGVGVGAGVGTAPVGPGLGIVVLCVGAGVGMAPVGPGLGIVVWCECAGGNVVVELAGANAIGVAHVLGKRLAVGTGGLPVDSAPGVGMYMSFVA